MTTSSHDPGLSSASGARIVILERPGCHLCETASATVHRVADSMGETVEHKNIETDHTLARRWSLEIPVIAVDGKLVSVYRITEAQLRTALKPKGSFFSRLLRR